MGNCVSSAVETDAPLASRGPVATGNVSGTPAKDTAATTGRGSALLQSAFTGEREAVKVPEYRVEPGVTKTRLRTPWSYLNDVGGLSFVSPQLLRPHGLAGVVSVLLGLYFTLLTLVGHHATPRSPNFYVTLYALCGTVACLGALGLIRKAPSSVRIFFQMGALLQIGMLYFTYRFDSFPLFVHLRVPAVVAHCADVVMAGMMVSTVLVLIKATIRDTNKVYASNGLKVATCCGIVAIGSLCGYPVRGGGRWIGDEGRCQPQLGVCLTFSSSRTLPHSHIMMDALASVHQVQLAIQGGSWLEKVYRWYPLQQVAFPYYVYIPATMGFNVIFFSATLHLRKLVSTKTFVGITLGFVLGTLIPTVVLQEVYIPKVSTQKLLIFSPPVPTSWWPRFDL